jgi:hypothetical protein
VFELLALRATKEADRHSVAELLHRPCRARAVAPGVLVGTCSRGDEASAGTLASAAPTTA